jgi:hypothetical protein
VKSGGERLAVGPGGAVLITPEVRHRAARRLTIPDVVVPPFAPLLILLRREEEFTGDVVRPTDSCGAGPG